MELHEGEKSEDLGPCTIYPYGSTIPSEKVIGYIWILIYVIIGKPQSFLRRYMMYMCIRT